MELAHVLFKFGKMFDGKQHNNIEKQKYICISGIYVYIIYCVVSFLLQLLQFHSCTMQHDTVVQQ